MPWTDLPATDDTDWSKRTFLQQFADAIAERIPGGSDYFAGAVSYPSYNPSQWPWVYTDGFNILKVAVVGDHADDATQIAVDDASALDVGRVLRPTSGPLEFMLITAINGNTLTVTRAYGADYDPVELDDGTELGAVNLIPRNVQATGHIRTLQQSTESLVVSFVREANIDYGQASIDFRDWFFTLDQARADAGLHADGFLRKYPREIQSTADAGEAGQVARLVALDVGQPEEGTGFIYEHVDGAWVMAADQTQTPDVLAAHGVIEAGDFIGPWMWNELRAMLDLCRRRVYWVPEWWDPPLPRAHYPTSAYEGDGYGAYGQSSDSFADAKAAAENEWALNNGVRYSGWSHAVVLLNQYSWGWRYRVRPSRRRNRVTLWFWHEQWADEGIDEDHEPAMTMDHYVRPTAPVFDDPGTFDDYGDGLTPDTWQKVLDTAPIERWQDWYRTSVAWGSDPSVYPQPYPPDPPYQDSTIRGWVLDDVDSPIYPGQVHVAEFSLVSFAYDKLTGA